MAASPPAGSPPPPPAAVDSLVSHLLEAKRSLSSMTLVVRANELATAARAAHEESVVVAAHTAFVGAAMADQLSVLGRLLRALVASRDRGRADFKRLIGAMDDADTDLAATMDALRATDVHAALRPGDRRNLLDFVDETAVDALREGMKASIEELQAILHSFDGDLARFDSDLAALKASHDRGHAPPVPRAPALLAIDDHAAAMAHLLASLTKHFDMCVAAVRATDGAAALARRRAADDALSLSRDALFEAASAPCPEPLTAADHADMLAVVVDDARIVDDVAEIHDRLAAVDRLAAALDGDAGPVRDAHAAVGADFVALTALADRLPAYVAADDHFRARWALERDAVRARLRDMRRVRAFYDAYADAYASLLLEAERRRAVDRNLRAAWQNAQQAVDRILDADRAARDAFRADVGEFLPTDLFARMEAPPRMWKLVEVDEGEHGADEAVGGAEVGPLPAPKSGTDAD